MADSNVVPMKKIKQNTPDPLLEQELGIERVLPFSSWGADSSEIMRDSRISLDDLVDMRRRDGQARALMRLFMLPILSALADGEWIDPDGEEGKDGQKPPEVDFANKMWNLPPQAGGMSTTKTQFVKKALQALVDGFAVFEEVRTVPDEGDLKGKIVLRKLAYRDSRTIRFRVDDHGGFNGIRQVATLNARTVDVKIPKEKVWFFTCHPEENPFYGVSLFEAAFYHYEVKRKLYYIAHLAAQFAAVPGRLGKVPKGADPRMVAKFRQALADFAFNTAMTFPDDYDVTPFNGSTGFDFIKLIDHHNHMMSKSVLSAFIDSEQRATLIEVGRVDPNTDFFVMALESIMDDLAESWSMHMMPKYIDWNFGTKKYPVFKFGQLSDSAKETIKEVFTTIVTSSVLNSTPEFVRELEKKLSKSLDLPIDYDEIEKQEKDAAQAEADKADQEAAMVAAGGAQPPAPGGPPNQQPPGGAPAAVDTGSGVTRPTGGGQQGGTEIPAALSAPVTIDDLVAAATELLMERPEDVEV